MNKQLTKEAEAIKAKLKLIVHDTEQYYILSNELEKVELKMEIEQLINDALSYEGETEIPGKEANDKLMHLLNLADNTLTDDSKPANCSFLLMGLFIKNGISVGNVNGAARSWMQLKESTTVFDGNKWLLPLQAGDIPIFSRGNSNWKGHVGIAVGGLAKNRQLPVFSFNRSNTAKKEFFTQKDLLKVVRPKEFTTPNNTLVNLNNNKNGCNPKCTKQCKCS